MLRPPTLIKHLHHSKGKQGGTCPTYTWPSQDTRQGQDVLHHTNAVDRTGRRQDAVHHEDSCVRILKYLAEVAYLQTSAAVSDTGETLAIIYEDNISYLWTQTDEERLD
ncbi:uncharacterized protein LOC143483135 [Brachyhypopomus gauderio]|uniref:uncharacterized protein LOC143483135 n=1 Tax=Brachyhypopomus gauderio TaxID=698409 RepID=UPI0040410FDC